MILYLSLILIVTGMFLIIYSLLGSKETVPETHRYRYIQLFKRRSKNKSSKSVKEPRSLKSDFEQPYDEYQDSVINEAEEKEFGEEGNLSHAEQEGVEEVSRGPEAGFASEMDSLEKIIEDKELYGAEELRVDERADIPENNEEAYEELDLDYGLKGNSYHATLYEDSSNIIDYDKSENKIDPTLKEYRNIKRVGKGDIELAKEGINFYVGKKFFRFDYYRIRDLKIGEKFIAVFLKGSNVVRVFIFDKISGIQSDIKRSYQDYLRRTG
jgi:hypothetical protein